MKIFFFLSFNGPDSSAVIVPYTQITVIAAGTKLIRVDTRKTLDAAVVRLFDDFAALAVDQRPQPQCFVAASCDERVPIQQQQARDLICVTDQSQ
jgi:hypothetical protein